MSYVGVIGLLSCWSMGEGISILRLVLLAFDERRKRFLPRARRDSEAADPERLRVPLGPVVGGFEEVPLSNPRGRRVDWAPCVLVPPTEMINQPMGNDAFYQQPEHHTPLGRVFSDQRRGFEVEEACGPSREVARERFAWSLRKRATLYPIHQINHLDPL